MKHLLLTTVTTTAIAGILAALCAAPAPAAPAALKAPPEVRVGTAVAPDSIEIRGFTLTIGASTAAGVRKAEGRKPQEFMPVMGKLGESGSMMTFRFKLHGKECRHDYGFAKGSGLLTDFDSTCANTKLFNGIHPGMGVLAAQALTPNWINGRYGTYVCPVDAYILTVQYGGNAIVVATADSLDLTQGGTAKIDSVASYFDGPDTVQFASLLCEHV